MNETVTMLEHLLLIDSDREILVAFQRYLERKQFSVATADCGEEAVLQLQYRQPDLIVIEPVLSDCWAPNILKQFQLASKGIPIVALSNCNRCNVQLPFSAYFIKPISLVHLLEGIQAVLNGSLEHPQSQRIGAAKNWETP